MKENELFKNVFGLAVKLTGLWFIYLGFRDMPPLLQLPTMIGYTETDVISALLPVVFNLIAGVWLIRNKFLIRLAYPKKPEPSYREPADLPANRSEPMTGIPPTHEPSRPDAVEQRLASLIKTPKDMPKS